MGFPKEGAYMLFKKKSKSEKVAADAVEKKQKKREKKPKYVEAWGWAASAARFRGLMCIILSVSLVLSLALAGFLYTSKNIYVVGVTPSGERSVLQPVSAQVNFDVFIRHFLGFYACYSLSTIRTNIEQAMNLATKAFKSSFDYVLGPSFIETVSRDKVVQAVAVSRTEILEVRENYVLAKAYATRYRSVGDESKQVVYELKLVSGPITVSNPYGWYVDSLKESGL